MEDTQKENQPMATCETTKFNQCDDVMNTNASQVVSIEQDEHGFDMIDVQQGQSPKLKTGLFGRLAGFFRKKSKKKKTEQKEDKGVPGKNVPVPSFIDKTDDATLSPTAQSLKVNAVSDIYSGVPQFEKDVYRKQTKDEDGLTSYKLKKKKIRKQEIIESRPTQRVIKDQKQHGLFSYYDELINQTVLDKMVLDNLISRCILMIEDREEIIKPTTQRERNRVLLDILTDRPYDTFHVFKDVLTESDPHNSDIQELISRMQCTVNSDENMSCHEINVNDNSIRIQKNYTLLVNNIVSTTDVTDYLVGEDIMQHEEKEEVCASGLTTNESNRRFLDKLLYKDRNGYHQLLKALRHAEFLHIANEVSNTAVTELDQKMYRIAVSTIHKTLNWVKCSFCKILSTTIEQLYYRDNEVQRERQDSKEEKSEDFQFIRSTIEKLASTQDDVIPKNILDQFERRLEQWKEDDHTFVSIEAEK
ncbi:unnamed protein product [Mytilus edulis]|uniref:CARD domain-containing protein n=1 Tax=Mytilus edulis TaxID=6550 RepID=A0A8S3PZL8_MYTED|nr:unnamed protein product [Mytilus edulis]